jgi:hypothetical protein
MNRPRTVYFARCLSPWGTPMGAVKIGCSYGHELRLKAVAANQPFTMELLTTVPGEMQMEATVHLHLRKHRISGEFFHENAYVMAYIERVKERGSAFAHIEAPSQGDSVPEGALEGFLKFHALPVGRIFDFLGHPPQRGFKIGNTTNRKVVAAALLVAGSEGQYGRNVQWPADCLRGLLGEVHCQVRPMLAYAPEKVAA